ncbi:uncharacterized protein LOC135466235 isoform X2 [Liolophura sinensis]|uniref:uncharacterized protein LOC135466235 isoform X2 n=1 Tax=Liolophura sinensis TaxID=3198878 RepID=UPI0031581608
MFLKLFVPCFFLCCLTVSGNLSVADKLNGRGNVRHGTSEKASDSLALYQTLVKMDQPGLMEKEDDHLPRAIQQVDLILEDGQIRAAPSMLKRGYSMPNFLNKFFGGFGKRHVR